VPGTSPFSSTINQNAAHRFGSSADEVPSIGPLLFGRSTQSQPCLMNQCSRLKRLAGLFMGHLASRQAPQLVINERQQLFCGVRVALLNAVQNACDFAHANR
jgi:hypothetical protein